MAARDSLEQGRSAFADERWRGAYDALTQARQDATLAPEDLQRLGTAALLVGQAHDSGAALEAAYRGYLQRDDPAAAARCAFWLGMSLLDRGDVALGSGWLGRAGRAAEDAGECAEQGYLLIPGALQDLMGGDAAAAAAAFTRVATIAEQFDDADLAALAGLGTGQALLRLGDMSGGIARLDETMVAVQAGEVSPVPAGIIYCAAVAACHAAFDVRRAQEWTEALSRWCEAHPDLVPYRGQCLIHRAQIMSFHGQWSQALEEAADACERLAAPPTHPAVGEAHYQRGEIHRLLGQLDDAERAYREADGWGRVPQPGLAYLRVAQGRPEVAAAGLRRALEETRDATARAPLLAAQAEAALAADDVAGARITADELTDIAARRGAALLTAVAAHVDGAVRLVEGDGRGAIARLRTACDIWRGLDAPYEAARARVLIALACRELGDHDGADMELDGARRTFEQLGAVPELDRMARLGSGAQGPPDHGLSTRELEVLRLVAAGRSNRAIAEQLVISEHTVARHVQNIFTKIGVRSRTAAAAYAFDHDLA